MKIFLEHASAFSPRVSISHSRYKPTPTHPISAFSSENLFFCRRSNIFYKWSNMGNTGLQRDWDGTSLYNDQDPPTGINGCSFITQFHSRIKWIEDDEILSSQIDMYYVRVCYNGRQSVSLRGRCCVETIGSLLNCLPHSIYCSHSWLVGKSNRLPRNGSFLGPGGNGNEERLFLE